MYAYCSNNPVNEVDYSGTASKSLKEIWEDIRNAGKTAYDWINTGVGLLNVNPLKSCSSTVAVAAAVFSGKGEDLIHDLFSGALNPFNQNEETAINSRVLGYYKGELIVRHSIPDTSSCQIFGVIYLNAAETEYEALNHEWGHGVQERMLGTGRYITRIALPSLLAYGYDCIFGMSKQDYYSLPSERTADFFGGVNQTFENGQSYKKGSLAWSIATMVYGPVTYLGYYLAYR